MQQNHNLTSHPYFSIISIFKRKFLLYNFLSLSKFMKMATIQDSISTLIHIKTPTPPPPATQPRWLGCSVPISTDSTRCNSLSCKTQPTRAFAVPRRMAMGMGLILSTCIIPELGIDDTCTGYTALAQPVVELREYIDQFDGYSFKYPKNWIQVKGAGADIFFRDPFVLDENISVEMSSPSSSNYKSVEDLGPPQEAGKKVLRQYLTEFMSTRLGVRRESNVLSTSSRVADDGKLYYQVEVNIKSYANNNEMAVMPQDRVVRMEWNRRYLSVLGVENNRLYELRLQTPENVFVEEEKDLRDVMESFRVNKVSA